MKKKYGIAFAIIAALLSVCAISCSKAQETATDANILEIPERMFATQVNDIYLNAGDYLGKTIKMEGILMSAQFHTVGTPIHYIIRYAPGGCCGSDGQAGFEVKWAAGSEQKYPADNSWVEAIGVLSEYENDAMQYLYLELSSLKVLQKRGAEFVKQ